MSVPHSTPLVVLASRNRKKIAEMHELLNPHGIRVQSAADFPQMGEVVEDGNSFAENAAKKASETAACIGEWSLGEDSGLVVDALAGAPGIYSARYSGANATDESNNARLVKELENVPDEKRTAHYVCSIAVADPTGEVRIRAEGKCRGLIALAPRGTNGFGYDPYFLLPEYHRTFGELGAVAKRHLSHRARAFERLVPLLLPVFPR